MIQKRHLAKSITWRFVGSIDTFLLSFIIISDVNTSLKVVVAETISKIILYYFHERAWFKFSVLSSKKRHLIKPFTWRLIASLDTFIISSILFNDLILGGYLSFFEVFSKIVLYYIHEKLWYKSKYGLRHEK